MAMHMMLSSSMVLNASRAIGNTRWTIHILAKPNMASGALFPLCMQIDNITRLNKDTVKMC